MTETFTTISGSMYEINFIARRVRRITGEEAPTARQEADGQWKTYQHVIPVLMGPASFGLFFDWTGRGNGTYTSAVDNPSEVLKAFVRDWDYTGTVLAYVDEQLATLQRGNEYEGEGTDAESAADD